jgi:superfamily II DNA/RNA helicase
MRRRKVYERLSGQAMRATHVSASLLFTDLTAEGLTGGDRLMTMFGGMDSDKREEIKAAFQTDPEQSSVRILLATDAVSEGIDLQNYCSRLIHYEIPWNPNRLEQRNGRVDRHGQRAKSVQIHHFVGKGYRDRERNLAETSVGELEADLEFLMRAESGEQEPMAGILLRARCRSPRI